MLGEAPAMAMGSLYQTIGNSVAMAAANAVYAQQQANVTYQTATTVA
ncbi:MAG: RebB family R body protein [Deltaproteobacteria bacterium]|nr:RebB family R body protein [Deltaproteobacteria bacterium]